MKIWLHYRIQCEIEQISAAFTSMCSSKITLFKNNILGLCGTNKSFKVIRMSIEDYYLSYLVPIKNVPRLCKIWCVKTLEQMN